MSDSSVGRPLLTRPLQPDEWSETYLADVVRRHGVRRPWRNHLDQIRGALPPSASAGFWREMPGARTPGIQSCADGIPRYGGYAPPGWAVADRQGRIRYCPVCMVENRYVRARWRITELPLCTLHGCWLKDDLVEPAVTGYYTAPGRLRLAEASTDELLDGAHCPLAGTREAVAVWGGFESAAITSVNPREGQDLPHGLACALLLWRMLTSIAAVHRRQVAKRNLVSPVEDVAEVVRELRLLIKPTVDGMAGLLRQISSKTHLLAAARAIARTTEEETKHSTLLSLLPLADLHQAALAAEPGLAVPTKTGAYVFRSERQGYYSRNEALEFLGVAEATLDSWISRGLIGDVIYRQHGRKKFVFLSRTEVDRLSRELRQLVPVERFLDEASIDWSAYFALRRSGMLAPVLVGDVRHLKRQQVTATQLTLEDASRPAKLPDVGAMPLLSERCVKAAGGQGAFVELLKTVLDGRVALTRDLSQPGWSSFLLPTESLAALSHTRRASWTRRCRPACINQVELFEEASC